MYFIFLCGFFYVSLHHNIEKQLNMKINTTKAQQTAFKRAIEATPVDVIALQELSEALNFQLKPTKKRMYDVRHLPVDFETIHYEVEAKQEAKKIRQLNKDTADKTAIQLGLVKGGKNSMSIDDFITMMERTGYELKVVKKRKIKTEVA